MNSALINGNGASGSKGSLKAMDHGQVEEKQDYESAVIKLHSLVSNAEALAAVRANRQQRQLNHIAKIKKFIVRSGLKEDDVDKMSMIHVSGTKGKGSTCAFCERILHSKGYKTGLFSSPHLVEVRERIRINGRPVSKDLYAHYFWKVYNRLKEMQEDLDERLPAYFAFNMILCLHIFLAEGVDVSIMEVGIGGQYDSTNFIRTPAVCGMTSLGYDHTSILGHTLEEIAWNKAGIFKTGCPAIVVNQAPSAMQVILNRAKERQSPLYLASSIDRDMLEKEKINLGISGSKQKDNAGLALQLARMWEKRHSKAPMEPMVCNVSDGTSVDDIPVLQTTQLDSSTAEGLSTCVWPGRAQIVSRPGVTYYLDGAHTRESIEVCSQWFKEKADEEMKSIQGRVVRVLIFNVTGDRKPGPLMELLKDCCFDAAGFPTNTVSTVESFNRKDQVNPMYTSKALLEKTEENRICWENITQNSHKSSTGNLTISPTSDASILTDSDLSSVNVVKKRIIDNPSSPDTLKAMAVTVSGPTSNRSTNDKVAMETFSRGYASSTSPKGHLTNGHPVELVENNNNNNASNCLNKSDSDASSESQGKDRSVQTSSVNDGSCVEKECRSENIDGDENILVSTQTCHSFPCLLQALTWATQAKDPIVSSKDPNAQIPKLPPAFSGANHIQVLVTGSLHLVGGVLGVITPDMND